MYPKVSIIIPLHNAEEYLAQTIESALSQTYQNIEIIIVENGSSDNSLKIANNYSNPKIFIYSIGKSSASGARNYGFKKSTGDFIQYLDADDLLSNDKIESQIKLLKHDDTSTLISCGWGKFRKEPSEAKFISQKVWSSYPSPIEWLLDSWQNGGMMAVSSWLTSKKLIEKAGKWREDISLHDDGEFFCRVILNSKQIIFDKNAKVYYRDVSNSLSKKNQSQNAIKSYLKTILSYKSEIEKIEKSKRVENALLLNFAMFIYTTQHIKTKYTHIAYRELEKLPFRTKLYFGSPKFQRVIALIGTKLSLKLQIIRWIMPQ